MRGELLPENEKCKVYPQHGHKRRLIVGSVWFSNTRTSGVLNEDISIQQLRLIQGEKLKQEKLLKLIKQGEYTWPTTKIHLDTNKSWPVSNCQTGLLWLAKIFPPLFSCSLFFSTFFFYGRTSF